MIKFYVIINYQSGLPEFWNENNNSYDVDLRKATIYDNYDKVFQQAYFLSIKGELINVRQIDFRGVHG